MITVELVKQTVQWKLTMEKNGQWTAKLITQTRKARRNKRCGKLITVKISRTNCSNRMRENSIKEIWKKS